MRASVLGMLFLASCCGSGRGAATAPATVRPQPAAAADRAGDPAERAALVERVRAETRHAWRSYVKYAWGHDELRPATHGARDWYGESLLITPVDALDTLVMLGLTDEAAAARKLIDETLSFDKDVTVKNFEIAIRVLGGLLSGYQLTGDARLLALADDLGARLLPVFASPTGMPYMYVNLKTGKVSGAKTNPAEIGTLLLELGALSKLVNKPVYFDKAKNAVIQLYKRRSQIGLVGEEIDVETGQWTNPNSHVGGAIDSYYEYLLKGSILFGDDELAQMWKASAAALDKYVAEEVGGALWYGQVDMTTGQRTASEFGALHAFLPGVLVLAGDVARARRLQDSAYRMWQLRGIEPEVLDYRAMKITAAGYPLRPEIIESAWYLRRATGDAQYLAMGKAMLDALIAHTRTDDGFTVLKSVETMEKGDLQPSYFLAESLKYFYLLFAPDGAFDLDRVVFTTEAHPLRRTW
ncbi:MAG TPA: glycoside hydrolase family 47 protein [Kofleriaceae bacterium]|nr:glycoside hydrolase family 47 protein [Kofleriaceae bacterium]